MGFPLKNTPFCVKLRSNPSANENHSVNTCGQDDKGHKMKEQENINFHTGQSATDGDSIIKKHLHKETRPGAEEREKCVQESFL